MVPDALGRRDIDGPNVRFLDSDVFRDTMATQGRQVQNPRNQRRAWSLPTEGVEQSLGNIPTTDF